MDVEKKAADMKKYSIIFNGLWHDDLTLGWRESFTPLTPIFLQSLSYTGVNLIGGCVSIRVAVKNDVVKISNLVASLSHFYLKNPTLELPKWFEKTLTESAFLNRVEGTEYANFVYEKEGEIIGYIAMKGDSHLYHLFVSEEHQGKGLSRALWQFATKNCVSNVYTLRSSLYAVPVYKKFGFIESDDAGEKDGIGFQPMQLRV